jgi:signal peptidase I
MGQICRLGRMLRRAEPWRWSFTVILAALVGIAGGRIVIGSLGSIAVVDGSSMAPTYQSEARVYTVPLTTPVARGDIVLVDDGKKEYALKRVVGMPWERVQLWRGYVFINGKMLMEPYLPKYTFTFPDEHNEKMFFHLGDDEYFVLGDNRLVSADSRAYGPVAGTRIKSRVPLPESAVRAHAAPFTLPEEGKRTIRKVD